MGKNTAEYMRAYRARRKAEAKQVQTDANLRGNAAAWAKRILELQDEVAHLKRELAKRERPDWTCPKCGAEWDAVGGNDTCPICGTRVIAPKQPAAGFNSRPFTPAPKKGK